MHEQDKDREISRELPVALDELTPVTLGAVAGEKGLTKFGWCWNADDNSRSDGTWCWG